MTRNEVIKLRQIINKLHDSFPHYEIELEENETDAFKDAMDALYLLVQQAERKLK